LLSIHLLRRTLWRCMGMGWPRMSQPKRIFDRGYTALIDSCRNPSSFSIFLFCSRPLLSL
jgi:hypothetical protein